jgi:hypothetical protein
MFSVLKYVYILVPAPGREVLTNASFKTVFPKTSIFNSASTDKSLETVKNYTLQYHIFNLINTQTHEPLTLGYQGI